MPVIYSRNFATGTQQYLSLNCSTYVRQLSIGSSWLRLRLGILCAIGTVDENAWNIPPCSFMAAVSSGPQNNPAVVLSNHAFCYGFPNVPWYNTATLTYAAGTGGNSYYYSNGQLGVSRWQAGAVTTSNTGSPTINVPTNSAYGTARRGILIFDFVKSALIAGNMTQGITNGNTAHMSLDLTSSDLYNALEWYASLPVIQGTALLNGTQGNSFAFNESLYGPLDTISLYWSHYTVPFQIYELAVYRVG